jgi:hypothetical protein
MISSTKTTIDIKQKRRKALHLFLLLSASLMVAAIINVAAKPNASPNKAQQFFSQVCPSTFHKWDTGKTYDGKFFDDCVTEDRQRGK